MKRTHAVAAITAVSLALVAMASPASAARPVIDHWAEHIEHIEQVEHADENWCPDLPFDVMYVEDAHGTFRGMVRDGKFYGATTIRSESTWTNVDTGKSISSIWQGQQKDLKVVDNGDGTITLTGLFTGPTDWYDDEGNWVFKDVGRTFNSVVLDEAGTPGDPDDDLFVEFLGSDSKGRFDTMDRDFCADLMTYIG